MRLALLAVSTCLAVSLGCSCKGSAKSRLNAGGVRTVLQYRTKAFVDVLQFTLVGDTPNEGLHHKVPETVLHETLQGTGLTDQLFHQEPSYSRDPTTNLYSFLYDITAKLVAAHIKQLPSEARCNVFRRVKANTLNDTLHDVVSKRIQGNMGEVRYQWGN